MLQELVDEINKLLEYKQKYEHAERDKKSMSNLLFEFMLKEYDSKTYEERCSEYKKIVCRTCRYREDCEFELPKNIWEPIQSDKNWIPGKQTCEHFKWG